MSDGLTRYKVKPMMDPDHPWSPSAEIVKDLEGGLVYAEEAEARIKELEAERDGLCDEIERFTDQIADDEARLRAADELADAVDAELALDGPFWIWEYAKPDASKIGEALTAYRKASNE